MKLLKYEVNRNSEDEASKYSEVLLTTDKGVTTLQGVSSIHFLGSEPSPAVFITLNMMIDAQVSFRLEVEEPRMFCLEVSLVPKDRVDSNKIIFDCHVIK